MFRRASTVLQHFAPLIFAARPIYGLQTLKLPVRLSPPIEEQARLIQGFRARIAECNKPGPASVPFFIGSTQAGEIDSSLLPILTASHPDVLRIVESAVYLTEALTDSTVEERTKAFTAVTATLREAGLVKGWRDELLSLTTAFEDEPSLLLERACLPLFGGKGYGVFMNGYCIEPGTREPSLWVATRSLTKPTWPGMLDVVVGGALSAGMSPSAAVVKEAAEEAGVPADLAQAARAVSCCSYRGTDERGSLKRDVLFCYDLLLPWDFVPEAVDGEVESFQRMSLAEVARAVAVGEPAWFKPNCNLVIIDFLVRNGFITPDAPGYLKLVAELRMGDCS